MTRARAAHFYCLDQFIGTPIRKFAGPLVASLRHSINMYARRGYPRLAEKPKGPVVADRALDLVGGAKRDRTVDLYNAIVALSQLSYGPEILLAGEV